LFLAVCMLANAAMPAVPLYVVGDPTQLHRVTMNLCTNAMHAMGAGGTLRVTASFGAASLPDSAKIDKGALIAAADAALYRAKRSGKNRTVKAG
jgi:GGDEF domain-containing protein